jgi:PII-like signaling protein
MAEYNPQDMIESYTEQDRKIQALKASYETYTDSVDKSQATFGRTSEAVGGLTQSFSNLDSTFNNTYNKLSVFDKKNQSLITAYQRLAEESDTFLSRVTGLDNIFDRILPRIASVQTQTAKIADEKTGLGKISVIIQQINKNDRLEKLIEKTSEGLKTIAKTVSGFGKTGLVASKVLTDITDKLDKFKTLVDIVDKFKDLQDILEKTKEKIKQLGATLAAASKTGLTFSTIMLSGGGDKLYGNIIRINAAAFVLSKTTRGFAQALSKVVLAWPLVFTVTALSGVEKLTEQFVELTRISSDYYLGLERIAALGIDTQLIEFANDLGVVGENLLFNIDATKQYLNITTQLASEFQKTIQYIKTLNIPYSTNELNDALNTLASEGLHNVVTAGELGIGMYNSFSAGIGTTAGHIKDAMNVVESAAKFAVATGGDIASVQEATIFGMQTYKESAETTIKLFKNLIDQGLTNTEQLQNNIGQLAAVGENAGVSIETLFRDIALSTTKIGEDAYISIERLILAFSNFGPQAEKTLQRYGLTTQELVATIRDPDKGIYGAITLLREAGITTQQELRKIFPESVALRGALSLLSVDAETAAKSLQSFKDVRTTDTLNTLFDEYENTIQARVQSISNSYQALLQQAGQDLLNSGMFDKGLQAVEDSLKFVEERQTVFGPILQGIIAFNLAMDKVEKILGVFLKTLMTIGAVVASFIFYLRGGAFVKGFTSQLTESQQSLNIFMQLLVRFKNALISALGGDPAAGLRQSMDDLEEKLYTMFPNIMETFDNLKYKLSTTLEAGTKGLYDFGLSIAKTIDAMLGLGKQTVGKGLKEGAEQNIGILNKLGQTAFRVVGVVNKVVNPFFNREFTHSTFINTVKTGLEQIGEKAGVVKQKIVDVFSVFNPKQTQETLKKQITNLVGFFNKDIKESTGALDDVISSGVSNAVNSIRQKTQSAAETARNGLDVIKNTWANVWKVLNTDVGTLAQTIRGALAGGLENAATAMITFVTKGKLVGALKPIFTLLTAAVRVLQFALAELLAALLPLLILEKVLEGVMAFANGISSVNKSIRLLNEGLYKTNKLMRDTVAFTAYHKQLEETRQKILGVKAALDSVVVPEEKGFRPLLYTQRRDVRARQRELVDLERKREELKTEYSQSTSETEQLEISKKIEKQNKKIAEKQKETERLLSNYNETLEEHFKVEIHIVEKSLDTYTKLAESSADQVTKLLLNKGDAAKIYAKDLEGFTELVDLAEERIQNIESRRDKTGKLSEYDQTELKRLIKERDSITATQKQIQNSIANYNKLREKQQKGEQLTEAESTALTELQIKIGDQQLTTRKELLTNIKEQVEKSQVAKEKYKEYIKTEEASLALAEKAWEAQKNRLLVIKDINNQVLDTSVQAQNTFNSYFTGAGSVFSDYEKSFDSAIKSTNELEKATGEASKNTLSSFKEVAKGIADQAGLFEDDNGKLTETLNRDLDQTIKNIGNLSMAINKLYNQGIGGKEDVLNAVESVLGNLTSVAEQTNNPEFLAKNFEAIMSTTFTVVDKNGKKIQQALKDILDPELIKELYTDTYVQAQEAYLEKTNAAVKRAQEKANADYASGLIDKAELTRKAAEEERKSREADIRSQLAIIKAYEAAGLIGLQDYKDRKEALDIAIQENTLALVKESIDILDAEYQVIEERNKVLLAELNAEYAQGTKTKRDVEKETTRLAIEENNKQLANARAAIKKLKDAGYENTEEYRGQLIKQAELVAEGVRLTAEKATEALKDQLSISTIYGETRTAQLEREASLNNIINNQLESQVRLLEEAKNLQQQEFDVVEQKANTQLAQTSNPSEIGKINADMARAELSLKEQQSLLEEKIGLAKLKQAKIAAEQELRQIHINKLKKDQEVIEAKIALKQAEATKDQQEIAEAKAQLEITVAEQALLNDQITTQKETVDQINSTYERQVYLIKEKGKLERELIDIQREELENAEKIEALKAEAEMYGRIGELLGQQLQAQDDITTQLEKHYQLQLSLGDAYGQTLTKLFQVRKELAELSQVGDSGPSTAKRQADEYRKDRLEFLKLELDFNKRNFELEIERVKWANKRLLLEQNIAEAKARQVAAETEANAIAVESSKTTTQAEKDAARAAANAAKEAMGYTIANRELVQQQVADEEEFIRLKELQFGQEQKLYELQTEMDLARTPREKKQVAQKARVAEAAAAKETRRTLRRGRRPLKGERGEPEEQPTYTQTFPNGTLYIGNKQVTEEELKKTGPTQGLEQLNQKYPAPSMGLDELNRKYAPGANFITEVKDTNTNLAKQITIISALNTTVDSFFKYVRDNKKTGKETPPVTVNYSSTVNVTGVDNTTAKTVGQQIDAHLTTIFKEVNRRVAAS